MAYTITSLITALHNLYHCGHDICPLSSGHHGNYSFCCRFASFDTMGSCVLPVRKKYLRTHRKTNTYKSNTSGAETGIFRETWVNTMATDVLAPCAARSSAAMVFRTNAIEDIYHYQ